MAKTEAPQPTNDRSNGSSWIPAAVGLVSIALFIGWLVAQRPDPGVAVAEPGAAGAQEGPDPAAPAAGPATVIQPDQLSGTAARDLIGQDVELASVPVISPLGPQLFWIELPGGAPFLVRMDEALVARGGRVEPGRNARIVGRVLEKDDAVLDSWQQAGVLQSDDHRVQAEYGTTYIEARQVQPAAN